MKVLFITRVVQTYRAPFHEGVRQRLAEAGVRYDVAYGEPELIHKQKKDTVELEWGLRRPSLFIGPRNFGLLWQPFIRSAQSYDLVIIGQENKYFGNYLLQLGRRRLFGKVAFWGHGRNFQARSPKSAGERWKRLWATRADWWFGYTDETRRYIESLGFPSERITVFNNSIDTSEMRALIAEVTTDRLAARRVELGISGDNVGIFVGGLYEDKRLTFLIDAADRICARVPDFTLILAGGGEQLALVQALALTRPWLKVTGPLFGIEKVELMMLARLFLMPGLVGLAVVDAGAAELPTITTAFPYHSPEIAYVEDGSNGEIVRAWEDPQAYADAVASLLEAPERLAAMRKAASHMAMGLTIEAMADRFAAGVLNALAA